MQRGALVEVEHLDAAPAAKLPLTVVPGTVGSGRYCPSSLAESVEQQDRSCRVCDVGGRSEQLLGLLEGRPERSAAVAATSPTGRCVAKRTNVPPHGVTAREFNVIPGAAYPRSPGKRSFRRRRGHAPILASEAVGADISDGARAARSGPRSVGMGRWRRGRIGLDCCGEVGAG